ncbi:conserved hypothetical protein (plasmid) [Rhodoferax ferrireducens T118]|uniref:Uncharacterized protein n=1 Tax=Albidiferax ferrireducens (strain ATCC BAA-621 / DSM 15236 / T118) TaxID=338969 RepID=Q21Q83_ALBFT|nr:hypothetical protein [Rhodoferax ferrireducens]ABD72062.1 conserved hypothetical protein [Rhodoferax ferrireducens T118]
MDKTYPDPRAWIQAHIANHLGSNIRQYTWRTWLGQPKVNSLGGLSFLQAAEGKVVEMDDDLILVKTSAKEFCIVAKDLLNAPVEVEAKVKLTFYDLRDFDGLKSDGSDDPSTGGCKSFMLTGAKTLLPAIWEERGEWSNRAKAVTASWTTIQNPYLRDLIKQLEGTYADSCRGRNLVNVLVDANGTTPIFIDPSEAKSCSEDKEKWPAIITTVNSAKFRGRVAIRYDRGADTYEIELTPNLGEARLFGMVHFDDLQPILVGQIEDDSWQSVNVEILKAAPKKKRVLEAA